MVMKQLAVILLPLCALAQDAGLTAISKTIQQMRQHANQHQEYEEEFRRSLPTSTNFRS